MTATLLSPYIPGPPVPVRFVVFCVPAGFPSPADDYVEEALDLSQLVGADPNTTFYMRADGESALGVGIFPGDVLVVERDAEARTGDIVVACVDGEFTVKKFVRRAGRVALLPARDGLPPGGFEPILLREGQELIVWGVVTHSLRMHRPPRRPSFDG